MARRTKRPSTGDDGGGGGRPLASPLPLRSVTARVADGTSLTLRRGRAWTLSPDVNRPVPSRVEVASCLRVGREGEGGEVRPCAAVDSDAGVSASASGRLARCVSFDVAAARPWRGPPSSSLDVRVDERYRAPSYGAVIERRARLKADTSGRRPWATLAGTGRPVGGGSALGFELGSDLDRCTALAVSGELVTGGGGGGGGAASAASAPAAPASSAPSPSGPSPPSAFKLTAWVPVGPTLRPGWRLDARGGGALAHARGVVCTGGGPPGTPLAKSTWGLDLTLAAPTASRGRGGGGGGAQITTRLSSGGVRAGVARGAGAGRVAASVDVVGAPRAAVTVGGGAHWSPADGPVSAEWAGGGEAAPRAGVAADAKGGVRVWAFVPF